MPEHLHDDDATVNDLFHQIAAVCDGHNVQVIIPALSHMLVAAVLASRCSLLGVESFIELFREQLRAEWLQENLVDHKPDTGSETPR